MTPHKDPAKMSVDDQLKLLRNTLDDVSSNVSFNGMRLRSVESQVKILRTEVKDVKTEVKLIGKKMNKLYNMVVGFVGRIHNQDLEIGVIRARKEEHETRISKLEKTVYTVA